MSVARLRFIGSRVWHQPINPDETDVVAVIARNDPDEQAHVILYEERDLVAV